MKICSKCLVEKSLLCFSRHKYSPDGLKTFCKDCCKIYNKEWKILNKDKVKETTKKYNKWYRENRIDKIKLYLCRWRHENKEKLARIDEKSILKRKYNLSLEDYNLLVSSQDNRCKICEKEETRAHNTKGKIRRLAIDHDHKTGKVRGLLCGRCNTGIGLFEDNKELLLNAIEYLRVVNVKW